MPRPLMQHGVGALEALFAKSKTDPKVLKQLEHELQHRQVPRAVMLLSEVQAAIHGATFAAPSVSPVRPAQAVEQPSLRERSAAPAPNPVTPEVAPPPSAVSTKTHETPAAAKPSQPSVPILSLEDAYKLLHATVGTTWESIELTRRHLVQQSHPGRLQSMSPDGRAQVRAEAERVNVAYAVLSQMCCGGCSASPSRRSE